MPIHNSEDKNKWVWQKTHKFQPRIQGMTNEQVTEVAKEAYAMLGREEAWDDLDQQARTSLFDITVDVAAKGGRTDGFEGAVQEVMAAQAGSGRPAKPEKPDKPGKPEAKPEPRPEPRPEPKDDPKAQKKK